VPWVPDDYQPSPPMLGLIANDTLRGWALGLNDLWLTLGRRIIDSVRDYPQRYTLLWQPHGLIVPGGRFVESYYWDSLWTVLGLLRCNMTRTAAGVALNLVHLLETHGFVPNGGRVYYALPGRSQPPLLSSMVREVFAATGDVGFLARCYAALRKEYAWQMRAGEYGHAVAVAAPPQSGRAAGGSAANDTAAATKRVFLLNRFVTDQHIPRPESWLEDVHTAAAAGFSKDDPGAQILFSEIAAGAESGWDFTAR
jgi:alpha,alpha-trehalase